MRSPRDYRRHKTKRGQYSRVIPIEHCTYVAAARAVEPGAEEEAAQSAALPPMTIYWMSGDIRMGVSTTGIMLDHARCSSRLLDR